MLGAKKYKNNINKFHLKRCYETVTKNTPI